MHDQFKCIIIYLCNFIISTSVPHITKLYTMHIYNNITKMIIIILYIDY